MSVNPNDTDADDLPSSAGSAVGHADVVPNTGESIAEFDSFDDGDDCDADDLPDSNGTADGHAAMVPLDAPAWAGTMGGKY